MIAIEPVYGMRATLEQKTPGTDIRAGQAEALPLESAGVDAIVAGQAFHWFANATALAEFARVLRPHGLMRNCRDAAAAGGDHQPRGAVPRGCAGARDRRMARRVQRLGAVRADRRAAGDDLPTARRAGLVDRAPSISSVAALDKNERQVVEQRARELAAGASPELRHMTELFICARRR